MVIFNGMEEAQGQGFKNLTEYNRSLDEATTQAASKITDATLEQAQKAVLRYGDGLNRVSLLRKVREFSGSNIADLCAHLATRNVGVHDPSGDGRWRERAKPTLESLEKRGGPLYGNTGSKHGRYEEGSKRKIKWERK